MHSRWGVVLVAGTGTAATIAPEVDEDVHLGGKCDAGQLKAKAQHDGSQHHQVGRTFQSFFVQSVVSVHVVERWSVGGRGQGMLRVLAPRMCFLVARVFTGGGPGDVHICQYCYILSAVARFPSHAVQRVLSSVSCLLSWVVPWRPFQRVLSFYHRYLAVSGSVLSLRVASCPLSHLVRVSVILEIACRKKGAAKGAHMRFSLERCICGQIERCMHNQIPHD